MQSIKVYREERRLRAGRPLLPLIILAGLLTLPGCERLKNYTDQEYLQKAKQSQAQGELVAAVIDLKNALQKNPKNSEARHLLGEIYVTQGLGSEAEKELLRAQDLGVNRETIKASMGRALLLQGLHKRVLAEIDISPNSSQANSARILEIRGRAHLSLRQPEQGCPLFKQSLERDAAYVPAHWGLARCAASQRNMQGARTELETALKLEDKNSATWNLMGDLERDGNRLPEAEAAYTNALKYQRDNLAALLGRALIRIQQQNLVAANQDIDTVFKYVKEHPLATHLRGMVRYKEGKYAEAKILFETTLRAVPEYLPTVLWLGFANYAQQNYEQAAQHFSRYTRNFPEALQIQALLALVQAKIGGKALAQDTLELLSKVNVEDPQSLTALGQAHSLIGDNELAAQYLQRVVERQPDVAEAHGNLALALLRKGDSAQAIEQLEKALKLDPSAQQTEELLIQTLIQNKQYDKALQAIEQMQIKHDKSPLPYNYRGTLLLLQNNMEGARAQFIKAMEAQPGNPSAGHSLGLLAARSGNIEQARDYYQQVLKHNKDHLATLMSLYAIEVNAKRPEQARKILETAVEKHPTEPRPTSQLALDYLSSGNPLKALEVTREAVRTNPDDPELLNVRGVAYLTSDDSGNALTTFRRLVQVRPDSAQAHFRLAAVYAALRDETAMHKSLAQALSLDPKHFGAKFMLAGLNLGAGKLEEALRLGLELQQDFPNTEEGYLIKAEVLTQQKKFAEAVAVLEQTSQAHPGSARVVYTLARVRATAGDHEGSLKTLTDWQKSHPEDVRAAVFLGESYRSLGRDAEAIAAYEQALKQAPENAAILNNMSWLLRKNDPKRALQYAEKAYRLQPESAAPADTLGWLLVEQGETARGLELLQKAFKLDPKAAEVHYHYAAALAKSGEKARARSELERLLSSGKKFPQEDEARALLKQL